MTCGIDRVSYYERFGDELKVYAVGNDGQPSFLQRRFHRFEPRNLEQRILRFLDNLIGTSTYGCDCGFESDSWPSVADHLDMFICQGCGDLEEKWLGWDYLCRRCDQRENSEYHDLNPNWR